MKEGGDREVEVEGKKQREEQGGDDLKRRKDELGTS